MEIYKNIHNQRKMKGISQRQLAERIGIPNSTIARLESGEMNNPTLRILSALANEFNCSIDELVYGSKRKEK